MPSGVNKDFHGKNFLITAQLALTYISTLDRNFSNHVLFCDLAVGSAIREMLRSRIYSYAVCVYDLKPLKSPPNAAR